MLSILKPRDAASITVILKLSIILGCFSWALSYALTISIDIPISHLDGAFQTASGLYRLDAGHAPGRDFYPYLGIGPLLFLFPLFKVLGANLSASGAASHLMVFMVAGACTALIWHLVWRPRSLLTSLVVGSFFVPLSFAIASVLSMPLPDWLKPMVWPGYSLRPLRAAAPYLVAATYFLVILKIRRPVAKAVSAGLLTGAILLWSNDFAVPTAGLFGILFLAIARFHDGFKVRILLCYIVVAVLSWVVIINAISLGHSADFLRYNFIDVARDQWWYFAPYHESKRIFNVPDIAKLFSCEMVISLIVLSICSMIALKSRFVEHILLVWIGIVLFFGGLIPSVGGHMDDYFFGFHFWGTLTLGISCIYFLWLKIENFCNGMPHLMRLPWAFTATSVSFLLSLCFLAVSLNEMRVKSLKAHNDPTRFFVSELGGYLDQEWEDYIRLARRSDATNVIEEYWGIWSATRRTFPTWPVDSAIHALGGTRKDAAEALQGADLIITTKHSASMQWQPWNVSQNYWLYEPLLKNWAPYTSSPTTVVWRKRSSPSHLQDVGCSIAKNGKPVVMVQAEHSGFYEVEIDYQVSGNGRVVTMIRNNMSFGRDANGYVSVDPHGTHAIFPVYIDAPGLASLDVKVIGSAGRKFDVNACTARSLPPVDRDVLRVPGERETDAGVVKQENSDRGVVWVVPNGSLLQIYLGSDQRGPAKAGLTPHLIVPNNADHAL